MKKPVVYWFLILFALFSEAANASHIVGGELNYRHISGDNYEITLIVYRDCYNGVPPFDDVAWLDFFDSENNYLFKLDMIFNGVSERIKNNPVGKCAEEPTDICYEKATYKELVSLPPRKGGYKMSYKRCCWNISVTNIVNEGGFGDAGITVYGEIPDVSEVGYNSNPVFKELSPPFNCLKTTLEFDNSAIDADGDSITYHLFTPYNGKDTANSSGQLIHFPFPPPYTPLKYASGFDINRVMGDATGTGPLRIHKNTGLMTVRTEIDGQFVFGIEAREYRNGKHIGSTWRSYQMNTFICEGLTIAEMYTYDIFCDVKTVHFTNESQGAESYFWDFGDPANPFATSTDKDPSYTYSSIGNYEVTLVAISDGDSAKCTDTVFQEVILVDQFDVISDYKTEQCSNNVHFSGDATVFAGHTNRWDWDFGDGTGSNDQNPSHLYEQLKEFQIKLVAQVYEPHGGCIDSAMLTYDAVSKWPDVTASANKITVFKNADSVLLKAISENGIKFLWEPEESLNNTEIQNPIAKPQETTTYIVTVVDQFGCKRRDTVTIYVNPYRCGESEIFIPNAFTPNNDGENDYFRIRGEDLKELYLAIYNRWGELVYESTDIRMTQEPTKGWDGIYKGKALSPGVFVYYVKAVCLSDNEFIKKGNVTLIR